MYIVGDWVEGNVGNMLFGDCEGEITSHNVPPPFPCRQLEADGVGSKLLDGLYHKMLRPPLKYWHSATMSAWRVRRDNAIPIQTADVDYVCYLCFMEDAQVPVGLVHPYQRRIQSPVTTVTDVVGAEPNQQLPPRKTPSTQTNPLPTDDSLTPSPDALPVRACLPFFRSHLCSAPDDLPLPLLYPFPYPFSPLSYSVPFTSAWGTP